MNMVIHVVHIYIANLANPSHCSLPSPSSVLCIYIFSFLLTLLDILYEMFSLYMYMYMYIASNI